MIGFRERERRVFGARAAIFFLWVILVSAIISLVLSIHNESTSSNSNSSSRSYSIRPQRRERALFHAPSSPLSTTHAQVLARNGAKSDADTLYGDNKRIIHTGPNPLHN
ncbi:hypothetical protein L6164_026726 [Bauhinia variegata]|uniref:Uncharacterized protein n=1 Tax=Bauhinia variegata TaxID=167791 RepID=A0ACB9LR01_BAUVA|nr:hypothetical protein L6164_026726 [Bauhinia variegata]